MQALGLIETKGLIAAIESADAMLKAADVKLLEKTYVGAGLVSIIITGDVGAVKAAVEAGAAAVRAINSTLLLSEHVIPRPHEDLEDLIVTPPPLKDEEIKTFVSVKTESEEQCVVEIIEEHTEVVIAEVEETVEASVQIELSKLHNKDSVDSMVLQYGLEEAIEVLCKFRVIELRNLAREYKGLAIAGRVISKANKRLLLAEFRKYYGRN